MIRYQLINFFQLKIIINWFVKLINPLFVDCSIAFCFTQIFLRFGSRSLSESKKLRTLKFSKKNEQYAKSAV
ncbi:hypothetical protein B0A66_02825 [Flavobacterium hercynium]|uniref:Uncharacterized protein n=1 Tax=Flavobacterium hercynium TaxID=387094 RepID=A0A226HLT4_9FLAO|nr:hypothetical protein B0A66_02825 [Flavobacterium hercynium]